MNTLLDSLIGQVVRVHHPSLTANPVGVLTELSATHLVVFPIDRRRTMPPLILPIATTVLMVYGPASEAHREQVRQYQPNEYERQL